jgi:polysaccharide deacetylase 2 family uncharacterized protein YibQ
VASPRKTVRTNRRKRNSSRVPLIGMALVVIAVIAAVFFLDRAYRKQPVVQQTPPPVVERHKLPPREPEQPVAHEDYTGVIHHPAEPQRAQRPTGPGTLAVIIDDMGKGLPEARALMDIGIPLTFAIIPGLPKVRRVAEEARQRGIEVMVHLPMEPKGYPERRLEANGLLLSQGDDEIAGRVNGYLNEIPQAVGANNHMGSGFTENRQKMAVVLGVLKERGLFFVDSKTSPVSVGDAVAREMGVRTAVRNVFLDNIQESGYITNQLRQAASIARKRGNAIAICHPHPATIQTLAVELPRLRDEGITVVTVSRLVR